MRLQAEAELLKAVVSGGEPTKLIAVGSGVLMNQAALEDIASAPITDNVIIKREYNKLSEISEELRLAACPGNILPSC